MAGRQPRHRAGPHSIGLLPAQDATAGSSPRTGTLAIFDLDRTLLPGSSLLALGRAMAGAGLVSRRRLAAAAVHEARFRRRGSLDHEVVELRDEALDHIAGLERQRLLDLVDTVADDLVADVTAGARYLLDRHLSSGDFVVVLSASPQELVEAIAGRVGAHRAVGTRAEVVDNRFTGRLLGPFCYGAAKIDRLVQDIGRVDLADTWAYADSSSDLPLLCASGHPVAVNPDRRLAAVARQRRWPILSVA
jgi:HAD superfamily hydrolase (TIGR01490 family)